MTADRKVRLTKRTIDAIPTPEGTERVVVHDADVKGFTIRISRGARTFYLYRKVAGRPQRLRIGGYPELTPEAARKLAEKLNGELASGKDVGAERRQRRRQPNGNDPTLQGIFDHTLEHHWKPNCRTWRNQEYLVEKYTPKSWMPRRLSSFSKVELLERHRAIGKKNGPYAANRWREVIRRLFEVGIEDFDFAGGNPTRKIKPFTEEERERFVTPEELPRLFDAIDAAADVRAADFFRLALLTGARKTAILRMKFADIDLSRAVWTIPTSDSKNKTPVHLPLVPEAIEVVRSRLLGANGSEYVFPGRHGKGHLTNTRKILPPILAAAGLPDVRLHDLRRTYGSWQAAQGSSELVIGKSLGHKDTRSTAVYARLELGPVRESAERATGAMRKVVDAAREKAKQANRKGKA